METVPAKNNLFQKLYRFFQTNIGIIILILLCSIGSYPLKGEVVSNLLETIGKIIGVFLPTYVVILVLSRKFNWNNRQKIVNTFLVLFLLPIIQINHTLYTLQNITFILFLVAEVILIITDFFKWIFKKKIKQY